MATIKDLTFTQIFGSWTASFVSEGDCILQIIRESSKYLSVWANIPGMPASLVHEIGGSHGTSPSNTLLDLNIPPGLEVTVKSDSEVYQAKLMIP